MSCDHARLESKRESDVLHAAKGGSDDRRRPLKVLYCALGDDYGDPRRGVSFERANFEGTLRRMPVELVHFDPAAALLERGYWAANRHLMDIVTGWKPDVMFCVMFEEQMDAEVVRRITEETPTVTVGWFCDDHWRFSGYSQYWARVLQWVVTTDHEAVAKYAAAGQKNVILSQWAANHFDYMPTGEPLDINVSFVGMAHGRRRRMMRSLERRGLDVRTWGSGWENGRLTQQEMTSTFSRSRVNLSFAESSSGAPRWDPRKSRALQIKGRVFEVTACGGLLLTERAPHLEDYFVLGEEVVVFDGLRDLRRKARWLLGHEDERAAIALAGYRRTSSEHTYERRLEEIFRRVGLSMGGSVDPAI